MGWFSADSEQAQAHEEVMNAPHKAKLTHELLAGAASYEAAKAYEEHVAKNGNPPSHEKAKELMAALTGTYIDRLVETKGLDYVDKERVAHHAREHYGAPLASEY